MNRHPVLAFVGASGTGKSWAMIRRLLERPRVVLIDPEDDVEGLPVVTVTEAARLLRSRRRVFRVVVHTHRYDCPVQVIVTALGNIAMETADATPKDQRLHTTIAVDEWGKVWTEGGTSRRGMPSEVAHILNGGRKRLVSLAVASQGFSHFHPDVRRALGVVYLFRQVDQDDRDAIRRKYGSDIESKIGLLPDYHFIRFDTSTGVATHHGPDGAIIKGDK